MRARCFPSIGREHYRISLSPITAYSDGDATNLAQYAGARLVNIDLLKISFSEDDLGHSKPI